MLASAANHDGDPTRVRPNNWCRGWPQYIGAHVCITVACDARAWLGRIQASMARSACTASTPSGARAYQVLIPACRWRCQGARMVGLWLNAITNQDKIRAVRACHHTRRIRVPSTRSQALIRLSSLSSNSYYRSFTAISHLTAHLDLLRALSRISVWPQSSQWCI